MILFSLAGAARDGSTLPRACRTLRAGQRADTSSAALSASPSRRCRYAWTHAPSAVSTSCAMRCAWSQLPRASCHSALRSGAGTGGLSDPSVARNSIDIRWLALPSGLVLFFFTRDGASDEKEGKHGSATRGTSPASRCAAVCTSSACSASMALRWRRQGHLAFSRGQMRRPARASAEDRHEQLSPEFDPGARTRSIRPQRRVHAVGRHPDRCHRQHALYLHTCRRSLAADNDAMPSCSRLRVSGIASAHRLVFRGATASLPAHSYSCTRFRWERVCGNRSTRSPMRGGAS